MESRQQRARRQPTRAMAYSIPEPRQGYDVAAGWIASDRDGDTFIFRKFGELTARTLLYMQSELISLEEEVRKLDAEIARSDNIELQDAAWAWEALQERHKSGDATARKQIKLIYRLRSKLKEYHEALLRQADVARLNRVDRRVLDVSRVWFHGGEVGIDGKKPSPVLGGSAKNFLDDDEDLVALKAPADTDPLSRFLRKHWPAKVRSGARRLWCLLL
ncbi:hypothetical protein QBC46DRAFT_149961 [Diplogelasinospora grovesii]|uniref:DUF6594 domain-containing protein n=1 Tax=Diplogelasinospora grovesii TaxID=303347 RepID=A0AAN6S4F3_9PEZI|nr:hypothetical protein QBC46DRAFT_149961 [Diplogelasinospora grovesii]